MHLPRARLPLLLVLLCSASACRSPSEHRDDADREVYRILDEVRSRLSDDVFRIDPPVDDLRAQILAGQHGDDSPLPALSLRQVLEIAAENSRDFQTRREALFLAGLDLTLERWQFSVIEGGVLGASLDDSGDGFEATAGGSGGLSLSRLFETGARVLGTIGFEFARDISTGDGWGAFTNLSLNITQPILRGFGSKIVRENLTQAERTVLYEARAFERFRRTFAFETARFYFRVLQQMDRLRNEELNLRNLGRTRERNEAFAEAGLQSDIQVDQARQSELGSEVSLIQARQLLEERLDELKLFLGLPVDAKIALDPTELQRVQRYESSEIAELSEEQAVAIALRERLDHANVLDRIVDTERRVNIQADALRAGLDLSLDVSVDSEVNQPFDFDAQDARLGLGAGLDLPLNILDRRNAYRASLIARDVAVRNAEASGDNVCADVRAARRVLAAARESYAIQLGAVVLAERRVESAALNLEAGRASTRDVLEAQEDLVQAQNAATSALIDKLLAELALYRDLELLRVTPEGMSIDLSRLEAAEPPREARP